MSKFMMAKGAVPDKVNEALRIIWDFSQDAYHTVLSKEELEEHHGLQVKGEGNFSYFSFAWPTGNKRKVRR